ncbi:MAG: DUF1589 domain-containing protein [Rhodopirellula sp. JB055]
MAPSRCFGTKRGVQPITQSPPRRRGHHTRSRIRQEFGHSPSKRVFANW